MKRILFLILFLLLACVGAYSQTVTDCPHPDGCVVISRSAAIKALQTDDEVKALRQEVIVLKDAVNAHKDIETGLKVELAKAIGENTALKESEVRLTAWMDIAMKNSRKKCMPLSFCL